MKGDRATSALAERDFVVKPLLELAPFHILANGERLTADAVKVGHAVRIH